METAIQIFKNDQFGEIRTMTDEKGETFFVGKDVAMALGYKNTRDALNKHVDNEDKGVAKCDTLNGDQKMVFINESGLYCMIFGSKLESAQEFKLWVTREVLPSIRRNGVYIEDQEYLSEELETDCEYHQDGNLRLGKNEKHKETKRVYFH